MGERRHGTRASTTTNDEPCTICRKTTDDNSGKWYKCECCSGWTHGLCSQIPIEHFEFLSNTVNLLFVCNGCVKPAKMKIKTIDMGELKDEITNCVMKTLESVRTSLVGTANPNLPQVVSGAANVTDSPGERTLAELRFDGIPEVNATDVASRMDGEGNAIKDILSHLGENSVGIENIYRLGKFRAENSRPRTLLVKLNNEWATRKILAKSHLLKNYGLSVFISKSLSSAERLVEQKLLLKRRELIESGVQRSQLRIRNNKLFNDNVEVPLS